MFAFVPFGGRAPASAAACDGLVEGAAIDLSHWRGNRTPTQFKADTSVEIALAFARDGGTREVDVVANNHFDADGVLAVWTLLEPEVALEHASCIVAAAEAGDFDEWPADERGLRLGAAIDRLAGGVGSDRARYDVVLAALSEVVRDLDRREDLWGEGWRALELAERQADDTLEVTHVQGIAILRHRAGALPGPVVTRRVAPSARRLLFAYERDEGRFDYRYEMPGWSWADTVRRPFLRPPARGRIARELGEGWAVKGHQSMTGLLHTEHPVALAPEHVVERILRADAQAGLP